VEDVNSALSLNKIEPVYGLSRPEHIQALSGSTDLTQVAPIPSTGPTSSSAKQSQAKKLVNLGIYNANLHTVEMSFSLGFSLQLFITQLNTAKAPRQLHAR